MSIGEATAACRRIAPVQPAHRNAWNLHNRSITAHYTHTSAPVTPVIAPGVWKNVIVKLCVG